MRDAMELGPFQQVPGSGGRLPLEETEDETRGHQLAVALHADRRHRARLVVQIE
jgi:hypothetical protein